MEHHGLFDLDLEKIEGIESNRSHNRGEPDPWIEGLELYTTSMVSVLDRALQLRIWVFVKTAIVIFVRTAILIAVLIMIQKHDIFVRTAIMVAILIKTQK